MKRFIEPLAIMRDHAEMDRLVQGDWIDSKGDDGIFHGCMFGCAAQSSDNPIEDICEQWGLPLWLGYLSEKIFEGLDPKEAKEFPVQLLEKLVALGENLDLERARHDLAILRLTKLFNENKGQVRDVIGDIIDYHKSPSEVNRLVAESAAESVAGSVAGSIAESAVRSVESTETSAAWSAERAAEESVPWLALESAPWSVATTSESWSLERDNLFSLLNE